MHKSIEKHSFTISISVAVVVIMSLAVMSYNFATWKTHIETAYADVERSVEHLSEKYVTLRADVEAQEAIDNSRALEMVTIKGQLQNITAIVLEIKENLKN